jgi:hypothetical protein
VRKKSIAEEFDWQPFIGRSLAYLCLHLADMRSNTLLEQAAFLMQLGLPRQEAATVLGTSDESLRVLANRKAKATASGAKRKSRGTAGKQARAHLTTTPRSSRT